jgi:hypothetical protein
MGNQATLRDDLCARRSSGNATLELLPQSHQHSQNTTLPG